MSLRERLSILDDDYKAGALPAERRLQVMSGGAGRSGERISILKQRCFSAHEGFDRLLHRISPLQRLDALLV